MREEVDQIVAEDGWTKSAMQRMRKVDSFLKECQRMFGLGPGGSITLVAPWCTCLTPTSLYPVSMSRLALQDYTFSDGTFVPKGGMVSVAARAIHTDNEYYENGEIFDPWRFANMREEEGEGIKHQLVSTGVEYVPFGHGRHAWCASEI